jgi:hypothetical protein
MASVVDIATALIGSASAALSRRGDIDCIRVGKVPRACSIRRERLEACTRRKIKANLDTVSQLNASGPVVYIRMLE